MKYREPIGRINSTAIDRHLSKEQLEKIDLYGTWFLSTPADAKRGINIGDDKNPGRIVYINRVISDVSEVSRSNNSNDTNIFEDTEIEKNKEEVKSLKLVKNDKNNKR